MRKSLLATLLFLLVHSMSSQTNLVPNPSFEDLIKCPDNQFENFLKNWSPPSWHATAFCRCASWPLGVPHNSFNRNVIPNSGDNYIMMGVYSNYNFENLHSHMQAKLIRPLAKQKKYYISMHVRPVLNLVFKDELPCFSDGAGLAFSDTFYTKKFDIYDSLMPPYAAAIENSQGKLIDDTTQWTRIDGIYTAKGTEQYAIIGNFRPLSQQLTNKCNPKGNYNVFLNFDDIGVYEFDPLPDTLVLCDGARAKIGHKFLDATYSWNTGAQDSKIEVQDAGLYRVKAKISTFEFYDSVVVVTINSQKSVEFDSTFCQGDIVTLKPPLQGKYQWSNGSTQPSIGITKAGAYTVTVSTECGLQELVYNLQSERCSCDIFVPNVFSPNGDGVNDEVQCHVNCDFPFDFKMFEIFNRWGERVYSSTSEAKWDGTISGAVVNEGVYIWYLEYELIRRGKVEKKTLSGDISILR